MSNTPNEVTQADRDAAFEHRAMKYETDNEFQRQLVVLLAAHRLAAQGR